MRRHILTRALVAATALTATASGAAIPTPATDDAATTLYARARFAAAVGERQTAAVLLGQASIADPAAALALGSFRAALVAGDRALALEALARLERAGPLPAEAGLLRLGLALQSRDRAGVDRSRAQLAADPAFAALLPAIDVWIGAANDRAPPLPQATGTMRVVVAEERALALLATGRFDDGVAAIDAALADAGAQRALELRIAAAAVLARAGRSAAADRLLAGNDPALGVARATVAAGRPLLGAVDTPARGEADALVRIAADLARDPQNGAALALCRIATMLAPDDANGWLVTASVQALAGDNDAALAAIDRVGAADPFAQQARSLRVQLLARAGDKAGALQAALAAANAPGADADDFVALGDAQTATGNQRAAAISYGRARALATAAGQSAADLWSFYMAEGGAWDQAGDWLRAEPLLVRAVELAPKEPVALNYLGYSRLERKVDVAGATALIERAHRLAPDNGAITDSLGWARYLTGDLTGAVRTLGEAVLDQPGDPTINEHLGDAYWATGRRVEARYQWRAASVYAEPGDKARLAAKIADGPSASR